MTIFDLDYARQLQALENKPRKLFNTPDNIQSKIDEILNGEQKLKAQKDQAKINAYKPVNSHLQKHHSGLFKMSAHKRKV